MSVSILDRFRTPAWRPYRAGMFVLMGLSAVFPILHGVRMYGHEDMRNRIGLFWLVLQGFLYILGAGLYAVSNPSSDRFYKSNFDRLAGPNALGLAHLTFGAAHIKSSMSSLCWLLHHIYMDWLWRLIFTMETKASAASPEVTFFGDLEQS